MVGFLQLLQISCLLVTCIFLAVLWRGLCRRPNCKSERKSEVSVLVAARDEERDLPRLLSSLAAQDYPADLCEFVIIDDGSTDRTGEIIAEWTARDNRFKLVSLDDSVPRRMGPKKRALTTGFQASSGDIILTTDADCIVPPGWISGMVRCFDQETSAVCGLVHFENAPGFWARLAAFEGLANAILNAAVIGAGGALSCFGANFAYRRSAFGDAGGYDAGGRSLSGDDDLLLQKLRCAGHRIQFCGQAEVAVTTRGPDDARSYWTRKRRHLSAGRRYAAHWVLMAAIVYFGCLLTVLLTILKLAGAFDGNLFFLGWGFFSLFLLLIFQMGAGRFEQKGWVLWATAAALIFPISFVLIHLLSLFPAPAWKGRANRP